MRPAENWLSSQGFLMQIKIDECLLRPWQMDDAPALVKHANNLRISQNLHEGFPHPYTFEAADRWLTVANKFDPPRNFAIVLDGEAVGAIGFIVKEDVHRHSAEIGYWLSEAYWGRGIVTAALKAVSAYAFATFDICRLYAGIFEWNPASARVLDKAGYTYEGRLRMAITKGDRIVDELIYSLIRAPKSERPDS
jgi:[ribosomal protein S5]-alanine N-acetyltransferase